MLRRFWPILLAAGLTAAGAAQAGAELVLADGQVLKGRSVERKEGLYFLELEARAGDSESVPRLLPVPIELVREVRLTGDDDPEPTGIEVSEPKTLAGPPGAAQLPARSQQVKALGPPAAFRRGMIDPSWQPVGGWRAGSILSSSSPARWYQAPTDPSWEPRSDFKRSTDVTAFSPARWYRSPIDAAWTPSDGFASRDGWLRPILLDVP